MAYKETPREKAIAEVVKKAKEKTKDSAKKAPLSKADIFKDSIPKK